jgi:hypothetical protein
VRHFKRAVAITSSLAALAPAPVSAARWLEVGTATNGVKLFVDADSLVTNESGIKLSQRFVFPKTGSHLLSRVDQQVLYGCANRMVSTLRSVEYDRRGRVVRTSGAGATPPYRIDRGTLPEFVFDLVC